MSIGGIRLTALAALAVLLLATTMPAKASAGEWIYVGSKGYYSVYRVSEGVYIALLNESAFDYEYRGLLVKEFYSFDELRSFVNPLSALGLAVEDHLGPGARLYGLEWHDAFGSLEEERIFRRSVEELLSKRGVGARVPASLDKAVTGLANISLLSIGVPMGSASKALAMLVDVLERVRGLANTSVDLVVVYETLWPPSATIRGREEVVGRLSWAWESEGFEAIRGVGSALGIPVFIEVNGSVLEELGMGVEEALDWIHSKIPSGWRPVVFILYYNDTLAPFTGQHDSAALEDKDKGAQLAIALAIATALAATMLVRVRGRGS